MRGDHHDVALAELCEPSTRIDEYTRLAVQQPASE